MFFLSHCNDCCETIVLHLWLERFCRRGTYAIHSLLEDWWFLLKAQLKLREVINWHGFILLFHLSFLDLFVKSIYTNSTRWLISGSEWIPEGVWEGNPKIKVIFSKADSDWHCALPLSKDWRLFCFRYWEPTYEDSLSLIAQVPIVGAYVYRRLVK